jgi:NAD(P)-dependent dehydrogenase (short-subunit alcohol dehydrogenase family)
MAFATYPSLRDRVVLVTGGASGIGAEIVRAFAGQGSRVAFLDILDDAGTALARETGGEFFRCDITDTGALEAVIGSVRTRLGPTSVLVNNAANDQRQVMDAVTPDAWDWSLDINLKPQFFAARAAAAQMKTIGGGSIINFSSTAQRFGAPEMAAYVSAKAAIIGLTRSLARAYGPDNIRVNAIEPGAVMTERQRELWYKTQESVDEMVSRQIIRRVLLPGEIARTVLFLASDDSQMITKQSIVVDAGISA